MASLEDIMLLKKIAEEYCKKRRYSIEEGSIYHSNEKLRVMAFDVNKVRHSLTLDMDFNVNKVKCSLIPDTVSAISAEAYVEDECSCRYDKLKNIFINHRDMELFRGKDFKKEISNLWMDVYSKFLLEAGRRNMDKKGGVWSDTEMYVAELANIYCDTHAEYDIDEIEKFIEEELK